MIIAEIVFCLISFTHLVLTGINCWTIWKFAPQRNHSASQSSFSVIICAHNELENLKQNISMILEQNYHSFELILVLDRCTDASFEFLTEIFSHDPRLRVITINKVPNGFHPKKYGLTKAIELAKNDWILLTDADCRPVSKNWIQSFNGKIQKHVEIILGLSPYYQNYALLSHLIGFETYNTAFSYISSAIRLKPYMGVGRNLAYKKELFLAHQGFGELKNITGGDDDLFIQRHATSKNTAINIEFDSLTYSQPKRTWKEYFHQKTRHLSVGKFYRADIKMKLSIYALIHALMWLSFIILVSFNPRYWIISACFALVILIKGLISHYTSSKLHIKWNLIWFPILDMVYAILLPLIGLRSFLIKKIRWN